MTSSSPKLHLSESVPLLPHWHCRAGDPSLSAPSVHQTSSILSLRTWILAVMTVSVVPLSLMLGFRDRDRTDVVNKTPSTDAAVEALALQDLSSTHHLHPVHMLTRYDEHTHPWRGSRVFRNTLSKLIGL